MPLGLGRIFSGVLLNKGDNENISGSVTIDMSFAESRRVILTGDVTNLDIDPGDVPAGTHREMTLIVQQAPVTVRTLVFDAAIEWSGGTAPTITATINSVDFYHFFYDGDAGIMYGFTSGQDMS